MRLTTDVFYHGNKKKKSFFEGWYLKHQVGNHVYAFIPGISIEKDGSRKPFIQIINDHSSHMIYFKPEEFLARTDCFHVQIGKNIFSEKGMVLDIEDEKEALRVKGEITYGPFSPINRSRYAPSIMGPFSYVGFLECYHGVMSMEHELEGSLMWYGRAIDFSGGKGYLEKDWGTSFPKAYIWVQCNVFPTEDVSFFFSLADIPFLGFEFLGLISVLAIRGKEYRFATYHGGKVESITRKGELLTIVLKQKELSLKIITKGDEGRALMAPDKEGMNRIIRENASAEATVILKKNNKVIFRGDGYFAGFETVGEVRGFSY